MPSTSPDNLRFPLSSDTPDVPRDLGYLAADTQAALLTRLGGGSAVPVEFSTATAINVSGSTTSMTSLAGDGTVGTTFIAPPSGRALVTVEARIQANTTGATSVGYEIRTGGTVGSGTVHQAASIDRAASVSGPNSDSGLVTVSSVNYPVTGLRLEVRSSSTALVTGLTAGATYNIRFMAQNDSTAISVLARRKVIVIPL